MAVTLATLNEMAPGRVVAGIGAYWDPLAWKQGIERRKPLTQMREYVDVLRRLLSLEEGVTLEGEVVQVRDLTLDLGHEAPRVPVDVPIYIGPTGPKMMELSGEIADGVLINGLLSTDYTKWAVEHIRAGAAKAGKSVDEVDRPQFVNVAMADDAGRGPPGCEVSRYEVPGAAASHRQGERARRGIHREAEPDHGRMAGTPEEALKTRWSFVSDEIVDRLAISGGSCALSFSDRRVGGGRCQLPDHRSHDEQLRSDRRGARSVIIAVDGRRGL